MSLRLKIGCYALLLWAASALAACGSQTLTVTSTNDSGPGSLREALAEANTGDTIDFGVTGAINLTSGELVIGKELTIRGPGAEKLRLTANLSSRIFAITAGGNVAIRGLTIADASNTDGDGGAIVNVGSLTLTDSVVSGSVAGLDGGGISNTGELTLINTNVIDNEATVDGGGIWNTGNLTVTNSSVRGNSAAWGGGIASVGTLTVTDSTVSGNAAVSQGGGGISISGDATLTNSTISGNIANLGGGIQNYGRMTLTNSTVSGNTAIVQGGGIENAETLILVNTTISGNGATQRGGGILNSSGALTLTNSIIANSSAGGDCAGNNVTSLGHNLDSDGSCGLAEGGDLSNIDPLLSPLQDNGGPTFTQALLPGSPAIDSGDGSVVKVPLRLDSDQRGAPRLQGSQVDIGPYEREAVRP